MATNYKSIAKKLKFEGRAFINGKYVNAIDGKKFVIKFRVLPYALSATKIWFPFFTKDRIPTTAAAKPDGAKIDPSAL